MNINERIFRVMDRFLKPSLMVWLPPGTPPKPERVLYRSSLYTTEKVFLAFLGAMGAGVWLYPIIGLAVGAFGALILALWRALTDLGTYLRVGLGAYWEWWPIVAFAGGSLLVTIFRVALSTLVVYYINEWERRHFKVAIWSTVMHVGGKTAYGEILHSASDTAALSEAKTGPPGERVEKLAGSLWGRLWDGYLVTFSGQEVLKVLLPIRAYRGEDEIDFVAFAQKEVGIIQQVAYKTRDELGPLLGAMRGEIAKIRLTPPAPAFFGGGEDVEQKVTDLQRLTLQRIAEAFVEKEFLRSDEIAAFIEAGLTGFGTWVDLMAVEDPGKWDPKTGMRKVDVSAARAEAPPAISFPEA